MMLLASWTRLPGDSKEGEGGGRASTSTTKNRREGCSGIRARPRPKARLISGLPPCRKFPAVSQSRVGAESVMDLMAAIWEVVAEERMGEVSSVVEIMVRGRGT